MRALGFGLVAIGLAVATGAEAQADLRAATLDYARAWDCSASPEFLERLATEVLGEAPGAATALLEGMVAAGEAERDDYGGFTVLPPLCEASADSGVLNASSWIEEWLYTAEGCRLPVGELAARAEEQELGVDGFDAALGALVASGMLAQEGGEIVHRIACRPPPPPPEDPMERVAALDEPDIRAALFLHLGETGCRVSPEGRPAVVEALAVELASWAQVTEADGPEALAAIRARIEEVLDNPGRAYEIDPATGDLVSIHCSP